MVGEICGRWMLSHWWWWWDGPQDRPLKVKGKLVGFRGPTWIWKVCRWESNVTPSHRTQMLVLWREGGAEGIEVRRQTISMFDVQMVKRNVDLEPDMPRLKYGSTWVIVGISFYSLSLGVLICDILKRWLRWFLIQCLTQRRCSISGYFSLRWEPVAPEGAVFRLSSGWGQGWVVVIGSMAQQGCGMARSLPSGKCCIWDQVPRPGLCLS